MVGAAGRPRPKRARITRVFLEAGDGPWTFAGYSDEALAERFEERSDFGEDAIALGAEAWCAYTAAEPSDLAELLEENLDAIPFLRSTFLAHLARFPSPRTGLGRIETIALAALRQGPQPFSNVFVAVGREAPEYGAGDLQVCSDVRRLASAEMPLLQATREDGAAPAHLDEYLCSTLALTEAGRSTLAGAADHVRLNGLDYWLGGVHLQGREDVWRWDAEQRALTRA